MATRRPKPHEVILARLPSNTTIAGAEAGMLPAVRYHARCNCGWESTPTPSWTGAVRAGKEHAYANPS